MQTVYRIERGDDKQGMYGGDRGWYSATNSAQDDERHPAPRLDSLLCASIRQADKIPSEVLCSLYYGFGSIDQLRNWVFNDEWLIKLSKNGYVLAEYRSDEVYVGNTQAVFKRPDRRYRKHDIIKYFNLNKGETK